ncbi:MAG: hypothetical protein WBH31_11700 [Promethearchaeia archaeon]
MNENSVMKDLEPEEIDDLSLQKILNSLLNAKENLELKTHIHEPLDLAKLYFLADYLDVRFPTQIDKKTEERFSLSGKAIKSFITIYLKYMVSWKRESRREIIRAVSQMFNEEDRTISDKMTKNLK